MILSPCSLMPASSHGVGQHWSTARTQRFSLEEKPCLSSLAWAGRNSMTQSANKLVGWGAEDAQCFHHNGLENVTGLNLNILLLLAWGCHFCCWPYLTSCTFNIRFSQQACDHDIPAQWLEWVNECTVRPLGLFPSVRNKPLGSLVMGTPAEAKEHAIKSFSAWCLAVLPGALLQTKLCSPRASIKEPQWHWCGWQRSIPSHRPTATHTTSSSSLSPQEAMGKANSQSPLCWEEAAKNLRVDSRRERDLTHYYYYYYY